MQEQSFERRIASPEKPTIDAWPTRFTATYVPERRAFEIRVTDLVRPPTVDDEL
jgi:hypothetical protein